MTSKFDSARQHEMSLRDTKMTLPSEVQKLVPDANSRYYDETNEMHCGKGSSGGSKFEGVGNIFEVLAARPDLADKVKERTDDRALLRDAGASETAFLPATKGEGAPEGLPEALYYKVDGVEGTLSVESLGNLPDDTLIVARREKGTSNEGDATYTPVSFTALVGSEHEAPKTDFATVIVGREGGEDGNDELWTVHPGAPVKTLMKDYDFTRDLRSPDELGEGDVPDELRMTVKELKDKAGLGADDFVKIESNSAEVAVLEALEVESVGSIVNVVESAESNTLPAELADKLIEAHRGYVVANNLDAFQINKDHALAEKLIEAGAGFDVAKHLDKYEGVDVDAIADTLIARKQGRGVARNLDKFTGINHTELADKLFESGQGDAVALFMEDFEGLDQDGLVDKLMDNDLGPMVVGQYHKFTEVDKQKLADRLVEEGLIKHIAYSYERFAKELDAMDVIDQLIIEGEIEAVWKNAQTGFKDVPSDQIAEKLLAAGHGDVVLPNRREFPTLSDDVVKRIKEA